MLIAADSVSNVSAIVGTVIGVVSLVVAILQYRRGSAPPQPPPIQQPRSVPPPPPPAYAPASHRSGFSGKALWSVVLGIMSVFWAFAVAVAAASYKESATVDNAGPVFLVAFVAIYLGFSARSEIRRNPGLRGMKTSLVGIGCAVLAALIAWGATMDQTASAAAAL